MEITLIQGILLALVAFICGLDSCWEAFYWFRPIVVAFFAGIALGNVQIGLAAGAVSELAYLGLMTIGGTVPPDPLMAGMMTTVLAYTTGQDVKTTLGLALPFALVAQWFGIMCNTLFAGFLSPLDRAAEKADVKKFNGIIYLALAIKAGLYALLTFVSAYALQNGVRAFVDSFPTWFIHGFEIAGGLLPGVGLALLLVVMLKKQNVAYLFIGFIMATFLNVGNVLPIAIVAGAIAFISFQNDMKDKKFEEALEAAKLGGSQNDGI
ncbi:MAG: PTS sugar transporter subunit IIC [Erysipelotrichaceae bacterium]|jgi:PTS system galactosamine-specific IIC component|nr:PTS sugar transporter subunit IIC [Erysipelotrichaceae bacterium]